MVSLAARGVPECGTNRSHVTPGSCFCSLSRTAPMLVSTATARGIGSEERVRDDDDDGNGTEQGYSDDDGGRGIGAEGRSLSHSGIFVLPVVDVVDGEEQGFEDGESR